MGWITSPYTHVPWKIVSGWNTTFLLTWLLFRGHEFSGGCISTGKRKWWSKGSQADRGWARSLASDALKIQEEWARVMNKAEYDFHTWNLTDGYQQQILLKGVTFSKASFLVYIHVQFLGGVSCNLCSVARYCGGIEVPFDLPSSSKGSDMMPKQILAF